MVRSSWLLLACLGVAFAAVAHHSGAMYDLRKTVELKGTVKAFIWTNPHSMLLVTPEIKEGALVGEWRFEMTSPGRLTRGGLTKRLLNPGDKITVVYSPRRDGSHAGWARKISFADGKALNLDQLKGEEGPNLQ